MVAVLAGKASTTGSRLQQLISRRNVPTIYSIQFLRFFAAAMVVFNHSVIFVDYSPHVELTKGWIYAGEFGQAGVHIFFVISGFVMLYTTRRSFKTPGAARKFLHRRFIRIYPIYWVYGLLALLIFALVGRPWPGLGETLRSLALWPDGATALIFTGWSLSYEVFFYLCFAAVLVLSPLRGVLLLSGIFVGCMGLGLAFRPDGPALQLATSPLLIEFLFGVWIGWVALETWRPRPFVIRSIWVLGLLGFAFGLWFGYDRVPAALIWGIPSGLLVLGLVLQERAGAIPNWVRRSAWLGDSSYTLYLLHAILLPPMVMLLDHFAILSQRTSILFVLLLVPVCVVLGIAAYEAVEKPLQRRLRKS